MNSVDDEVKRILAMDVEVTFMVTGMEINNCTGTGDVEQLVDRYAAIVREVLLSRIKEQHPRFN